jgi:hypothetical protein
VKSNNVLQTYLSSQFDLFKYVLEPQQLTLELIDSFMKFLLT